MRSNLAGIEWNQNKKNEVVRKIRNGEIIPVNVQYNTIPSRILPFIKEAIINSRVAKYKSARVNQDVKPLRKETYDEIVQRTHKLLKISDQSAERAEQIKSRLERQKNKRLEEQQRKRLEQQHKRLEQEERKRKIRQQEVNKKTLIDIFNEIVNASDKTLNQILKDYGVRQGSQNNSKKLGDMISKIQHLLPDLNVMEQETLGTIEKTYNFVIQNQSSLLKINERYQTLHPNQSQIPKQQVSINKPPSQYKPPTQQEISKSMATLIDIDI